MNDDKILQQFGLHLKKLRVEKKLSQEELGALSDLDRTYISGIERGKRNISLINIVKLSSALKTSPACLMSFNMEV